jgi:hypothetical protein
MVKRSLLESIATDDPNFWIRLGDGQENLPAHRGILEVACSCVKHLPETDLWDLSGMHVEDKPVQRSVVVAWLEVVYLAADEEKQNEQVSLADLLLFADAVGSTKRVLAACRGSVGSLELGVSLSRNDAEDLEAAADSKWVLDGRGYYLIPRGDKLDLFKSAAPNSLKPESCGVTFASQQQAAAVALQLAQHLEKLLYLAYKLQQDKLQEQLHEIILTNSMYQHSILTRELLENTIFSPRVMEAVTPAAVKAAYIDSLLLKACSLEGEEALLGTTEPLDPIAKFPAILKQRFMGCTSQPSFKVQLHLRTMSVLGGQAMPLRLVVLGAAHTQANQYSHVIPPLQADTPE